MSGVAGVAGPSQITRVFTRVYVALLTFKVGLICDVIVQQR